MGLEIIIPVVVIAVIVPIAFAWAKKTFKEASASGSDPTGSPGRRLTSEALRSLPTPEWRVVYEIAADRLGGVEHVVIGPPGVFAVQTSMEPLPAPAGDAADAQEVAQAAIVRGDLDDALRRCAMSSDRLVRVYWGPVGDGTPGAVDHMAGVTAVHGRALESWAASLPPELSAAQVDLAWQTVTTAIGRPDPLA